MRRGRVRHHAARARALYRHDLLRQRRVRVHIRPPVPWHASRTSHSAILSGALHLLIYVVLAVEWMYRVPVVDTQPFLDDDVIHVALLPAASAPPRTATVEASQPRAVAAQTPRAAVRPAAPLVPVAKPKPDPAPKAAPPRAEATPEPEPPKAVSHTEPPPAVTTPSTVAKLTEPGTPLPAESVERVEPTDTTPEPAVPTMTGEATPDTTPAGGPAVDEPAATAPAEAPRARLTPAEQRRLQIGSALTGIARAASGGSAGRTVDIVFLLDLSGSMENNLRAVGESLSTMMSELQSRDADATFGVVKFKSVLFLVFPQSADVTQYERLLANLRVGGDELALDALSRAVEKVEFRPDAQRRFVLVTDEPLKGDPPLARVLPRLIAANIIVDVIGLDVRDHRMLARATGGTWHRIPGDKS